MNAPAFIAYLFLAGSAVGIYMNSRMTTKRPNALLTFGNTLFFVGPILFALRLLAKDLAQLELFGFAFALVGLAIMGTSFLSVRR
jgi:uncharacterized membrane protein YgdD (TMEM256/DUF423 family)